MKNNHHRLVPTDAELEILQILWTNGPLSVRKVNELLNEQREVGYTTTLKILQIMTEKSLVVRDTSARTHIYSAQPKKDATTNTLLQKFLKKAYNGSVGKLVMQALGNHDATPEELEEIKDLIHKIQNNDHA